MLQADSIRDAAWECDWVGAPVTFQRCILFIIVATNKRFELTAGKVVGVSNTTMAKVRISQNLPTFHAHEVHQIRNKEESRVCPSTIGLSS
jgi:hypothetical protein